MYSLGFCILENITGIPASILINNLKDLRKNSENFLKGYTPALRNLLASMVSSDPHKRPDASCVSMFPKQNISKK